MIDIIHHLGSNGVIPVVTIKKEGSATKIALALLQGGITTIEITLRTDKACDSISQIKKMFPDLIVGAGTVTTIDRFKDAVNAGADYFVTPGLDEEIVRLAISLNKTIFPGILTPTELGKGMALGLNVFKFFPSEAFGGIKSIKALAGPFPNVLFIPTGGISLENSRAYLEDKHVLAVGGSWLVKSNWVEEGKFDEIVKRAAEAHAMVIEARKEASGNV
ncbi:MAG: bifunctional 4-hydroxy-2-oxoglutarate aldolase/2-dehydro-3-deoxy-phosphogluconate aldolase [Anaerolineaceae bacterium]